LASYLDTSALVKLVVAEPETAALRSWLEAQTQPLVSSDLARTEMMRATRRAAPHLVIRAREVLDILVLTQLSSTVFDHAGRMEPARLRTLDAVHLAAAIDLGDDLEALITYDERLAEAARSNGVPVLAPV
jgi:predicted nucleic acid-binding protein